MFKKKSHRIQRISQEIQKKISVILQYKIDDPRVGIPTISSIQMSKDLKYAKVFLTFLDKNESKEINSAILILQRASGFIRFVLARSMNLRIVPILLFKYDPSLLIGSRINSLISQSKITIKKHVYSEKEVLHR